jgi:hypothetical protein
MKKLAVKVAVASALLSPWVGAAVGQSSQLIAKSNQPAVRQELKAQETPAPVTAPLSVGTAFNASLTESLDTRKAKAGDIVTAEAAEDVTYERSVIFPKGTKIVGHLVRASVGGHGRGSALFVQFDKAVLSDGQEVVLNAGIQALSVDTSIAAPTEPNSTKDLKESDAPAANATVPVEQEEDASNSAASIKSTIYDVSPRGLRVPLYASTAAEGEIGPDGLFTPESKGAFGRPDLKIYTPTSPGSHGTVLLSTKKHIRLDGGTRLLLVVQPPASPDAENSDTPALDVIDK